jgi:hypothetical protein
MTTIDSRALRVARLANAVPHKVGYVVDNLLHGNTEQYFAVFLGPLRYTVAVVLGVAQFDCLMGY